MTEFPNIVRDPNICGGQPTIKATRVLVLDILDYLKNGEPFEEILKAFPTIKESDIREAITYAQHQISGEIIVYET